MKILLDVKLNANLDLASVEEYNTPHTVTAKNSYHSIHNFTLDTVNCVCILNRI